MSEYLFPKIAEQPLSLAGSPLAKPSVCHYTELFSEGCSFPLSKGSFVSTEWNRTIYPCSLFRHPIFVAGKILSWPVVFITNQSKAYTCRQKKAVCCKLDSLGSALSG